MYPRISDLFDDLFGVHVPLPLYSFGLMVATAILVAGWIAGKELDRMYKAGIVGPVRVPVADKEQAKRGKTVAASPSVLMGLFITLALVLGVAGSKLFHVIDNWSAFTEDPAGMLFATSGLTFYGGLICAALGIGYAAHRKGLSVPRLADALAPTLILGYGIGRLGCYLSGDGDWGVCSQLEDKPGWIPSWLWSETFPRNLSGPGGTAIDPLLFNAQVRGEVCTLASPDGVYPTMLYEFAMGVVLAGVLWALRKHPFKAGWLFSLYAVFTGLERFLIETIRVNPVAAFGLSQAQLISIGFVAVGLAGLAVTTRRVAAPPSGTPDAAPVPA